MCVCVVVAGSQPTTTTTATVAMFRGGRTNTRSPIRTKKLKREREKLLIGKLSTATTGKACISAEC